MSASNTIQTAVQRYLDERRQLGFDLRVSGRELMRFARYADARRHQGPLTLEVQLGWAREHVRHTGTVTWARRLELLRPFAAYYQQFEPDSVVPNAHEFGRGHRRLTPHIYTELEIKALMDAAGALAPGAGLRPATYRMLFGLIASVGLRLSEALTLNTSDIDLALGTLLIRQTKFNKSRCLPLHASVVNALRAYLLVRDITVASTPETAFFVSSVGHQLPSRIVQHVFEQLRTGLGWQGQQRGGHPACRIHDLRHSFAVRRVKLWQESGVHMDQGMFWLCTYLGHAKISDTYWYLTGTPELMNVVGAKFERFAFNDEDQERTRA